MILGAISDAAKAAIRTDGTNQLDAFAQELEASDAQLETDLASADIMTYQFWAANHYQDPWVVDITQGDQNSPSVQATRTTLAGSSRPSRATSTTATPRCSPRST